MRPFSELKSRHVTWVHRGVLRRRDALKDGDRIVATLEWKKPVGSLALGECAEGTFSFKRGGFLRPHITVRRPPSKVDLARMRMGFGGHHTLEFVDHRRYDFERIGVLTPEYVFTDVKGREFCRILAVRGSILLPMRGVALSAEVVLGVDPRTEPDLELLVLVGWYAIVLEQEEAAVGWVITTTGRL